MVWEKIAQGTNQNIVIDNSTYIYRAKAESSITGKAFSNSTSGKGTDYWSGGDYYLINLSDGTWQSGTGSVYLTVERIRKSALGWQRIASKMSDTFQIDVSKYIYRIGLSADTGSGFAPFLKGSTPSFGKTTGEWRAADWYIGTAFTDGTWSVNVVNADAFVERMPLNNPPTLTLTSPANNLVLTEGKTYTISGSATDTNNGNVVTIKYKINNGTARAINSGVSDGSTPIAFSKNLTYRNKRLWDGSTDVVGYDLAEGTNHTLYVWAEDDQGGKSPDTTRSFTVIWNRPPVISGTDKNLGTISAPPSQDFSVTDPEGNPFTIEYYLDDQRFNSFPGVSGQTYTVSLTNDQWIRTSLAQHKLKVRAIDNQGAYSDRIFTFTRTDDRINFTLNYANTDVRNFFTTDQRANRILVTLDAVIPSGATLLVEACNNAYDDTPTWEDITAQAQAGRGYIFTNTTSTSGQWGINIRIQILKGSATETVLLNGFGGAFD
ncbi:Ig-like domain-containing protein [Brevibacillus parabrevis]|uniref:Ig-like domain-containing protein n=1 Tax=Brevibacillus parabrevis TaxID=54914 RepID=UPI003D1F94C4